MGPGLSMQGGTLQNIPPNASREEQTAALNDVINRLNGLLKQQVFSDGSTKRMIIGYQKGGWGDGKDFGIKISIEGVDVTKATDSQLLFKMDMETWSWFTPNGQFNHTQIGVLPDGTGGIDVAATGHNVAEAYP